MSPRCLTSISRRMIMPFTGLEKTEDHYQGFEYALLQKTPRSACASRKCEACRMSSSSDFHCHLSYLGCPLSPGVLQQLLTYLSGYKVMFLLNPFYIIQLKQHHETSQFKVHTQMLSWFPIVLKTQLISLNPVYKICHLDRFQVVGLISFLSPLSWVSL